MSSSVEGVEEKKKIVARSRKGAGLMLFAASVAFHNRPRSRALRRAPSALRLRASAQTNFLSPLGTNSIQANR